MRPELQENRSKTIKKRGALKSWNLQTETQRRREACRGQHMEGTTAAVPDTRPPASWLRIPYSVASPFHHKWKTLYFKNEQLNLSGLWSNHLGFLLNRRICLDWAHNGGMNRQWLKMINRKANLHWSWCVMSDFESNVEDTTVAWKRPGRRELNGFSGECSSYVNTFVVLQSASEKVPSTADELRTLSRCACWFLCCSYLC